MDGDRHDANVTDASATGDPLLPEPLPNRYAVPLSTLMGGAFVAHADQVVLQPLPSGPLEGGAVAGAEGDGD